jgi:hypothetical protein
MGLLSSFDLAYTVIGMFIQLNAFYRAFKLSVREGVPLVFKAKGNLHRKVPMVRRFSCRHYKSFGGLHCSQGCHILQASFFD